MKCYRFQKLLQTATASTIPVAVAITSTGKPASAFVPTKDVPRVRFSTHKPANASVQARESADLHLHTITTVADVSVQKIQVAVSHHIYSTSNSAHVSAQLNQNVQRHSGSILENACVNADIGQTSVLTNKSLMNTSANADAPKCSSALETNSSTTIPASVNVQKPNPKCKHPQVYNNDWCGCECPKPYPKCKHPQVYNNGWCGCECPRPRQKCKHPQVYDSQYCTCKCPKVIKCNGNQKFNYRTCKCECPYPRPKCTKAQQFNSYTCKCECPYPRPKCTKAQRFNPYSCQCECPYPRPKCTKAQRFNSYTCQCECPTKPKMHKGTNL